MLHPGEAESVPCPASARAQPALTPVRPPCACAEPMSTGVARASSCCIHCNFIIPPGGGKCGTTLGRHHLEKEQRSRLCAAPARAVSARSCGTRPCAYHTQPAIVTSTPRIPGRSIARFAARLASGPPNFGFSRTGFSPAGRLIQFSRRTQRL